MLDVLVNGEIAETAWRLYRLETGPKEGFAEADSRHRLLSQLRAIRAKLDRARPPADAAAMRAARAESVCDT